MRRDMAGAAFILKRTLPLIRHLPNRRGASGGERPVSGAASDLAHDVKAAARPRRSTAGATIDLKGPFPDVLRTCERNLTVIGV